MTFVDRSFLAAALAPISALALAGVGACGGSPAAPPAATNVTLNAPDASEPSDAAASDAGQMSNSFDRSAAVPIAADDPTLGPTPALVTVIEFDDFQASFGAKAQATLAALRQKYSAGDVRFVWKNDPLPFHEQAHLAAEAAAGVFALAGNDAFWKFHDTAFQNQSQIARATLPTWAAAAGVGDLDAFNAGLDAHTWAAHVDGDLALAKKNELNGAPVFLINGVAVIGAQPLEKFEGVIDAELVAAKAKVAGGTPIEQIYAVRTSDNRRKASVAAAESPPPDTTTVHRLTLDKSSNVPSLGPSDAPVTIVEFGDFECPYSKRADDTLKQVRTTYGDKVRIVWKDLPLAFHPHAESAAELAREARAEKGVTGFWAMHDALFVSQPHLADVDLQNMAVDLGLDAKKVAAVLKDHPYKETIVIDGETADEFGATNTPTFFINGRELVGAVAFEKLKALIDEEIVHAAAVRATGVKPAHLYEAMIKDGKAPTPLAMKSVAAATMKAPIKGAHAAKVVIQEFADFQCPFCAREEAVLRDVAKTYGAKVSLEWRNLPLGTIHPDAMLAAEAAMEAFAQKGDAGFWTMHDALFAAQATQDGLKRPALEQLAQAEGLDLTKFAQALDTNAHAAAIAGDQKAAKDAQITGTPSFVINGFFINGAQPYSKLDRAVRAALAETK